MDATALRRNLSRMLITGLSMCHCSSTRALQLVTGLEVPKVREILDCLMSDDIAVEAIGQFEQEGQSSAHTSNT
jgi:hypothetical protein